MIAKERVVLEQVAVDLRQGKLFYDDNQEGLYAGIHIRQFGLYRMLAKRFPFEIYYDVFEAAIVVIAVLDLRRNPIGLRKQLRDSEITNIPI